MIVLESLLRKTIFLSVLAHFCFLRLLIFTFPQKPIPEKPFFLFLGKIIPKHEFLLSDADQDFSSKRILQPNIPIDQEMEMDALHFSKPTFNSKIKKPSKITLKPAGNSLETEETDTATERFMQTLPKAPRYQRLKFFR